MMTLNDFFKELEKEASVKEAVGVVGPTPDPTQTAPAPMVMPRSVSPEAQGTNSAIAKLIAQLTAGANAAGPAGYIATPAGIVAPATARGTEVPTAATAGLEASANTPAKTAEPSEAIVTVYNRFFGGEN